MNLWNKFKSRGRWHFCSLICIFINKMCSFVWTRSHRNPRECAIRHCQTVHTTKEGISVLGSCIHYTNFAMFISAENRIHMCACYASIRMLFALQCDHMNTSIRILIVYNVAQFLYRTKVGMRIGKKGKWKSESNVSMHSSSLLLWLMRIALRLDCNRVHILTHPDLFISVKRIKLIKFVVFLNKIRKNINWIEIAGATTIEQLLIIYCTVNACSVQIQA